MKKMCVVLLLVCAVSAYGQDIGQTVVLTKNLRAAVTTEAYRTVTLCEIIEDWKTINQMYFYGYAFIIMEGESISILEADGIWTRILVLSGNHEGRKGWLGSRTLTE